jgi:antitoxin MazE
MSSADAQTIVISKNDDKGDFLLRLRVLQKPKPPGFVWNRDDANTR